MPWRSWWLAGSQKMAMFHWDSFKFWSKLSQHTGSVFRIIALQQAEAGNTCKKYVICFTFFIAICLPALPLFIFGGFWQEGITQALLSREEAPWFRGHWGHNASLKLKDGCELEYKSDPYLCKHSSPVCTKSTLSNLYYGFCIQKCKAQKAKEKTTHIWTPGFVSHFIWRQWLVFE